MTVLSVRQIAMTDKTAKNRIKELRQKAGMTQETLAFKSGLSVPYISRLESGQRNLSLKTMTTIAAALEVEPSELIDFSRAIIDVDITAFINSDREIFRVNGENGNHRHTTASIPAVYSVNEIALCMTNALAPRINKGDLIIFSWYYGHIRHLIGKECVIELESGRTLIMTPNPGSTDGVFHLTAFNAETILDAEIRKIARIIAIIPA